jgi:ferredoxin
MPKIMYYRNKCIGCNFCYETWPMRWRLSRKDGKSTLVGGTEKKGIFRVDIHADELDINTHIASACPVKIIKVEQ